MNSGLKVLPKGLRCSICFIALNAIWSHFLGTKLHFYPNIMLSKHDEQDQIDAKWLEEKS